MCRGFQKTDVRGLEVIEKRIDFPPQRRAGGAAFVEKRGAPILRQIESGLEQALDFPRVGPGHVRAYSPARSRWSRATMYRHS